MAYSKKKRDRIIAFRGAQLSLEVAEESMERIGKSARQANRAMVGFITAWARANSR